MVCLGRSVTAMAVALIAACAPAPGTSGPAPEDGDEHIPLLVENRTPQTVRVYARFSGGDLFLGRVPPLSESALEVPASAGGSFRLIARPPVQTDPNIQHLSEWIRLTSGVRVSWQLHPSPGSTSLPRVSTVRLSVRR